MVSSFFLVQYTKTGKKGKDPFSESEFLDYILNPVPNVFDNTRRCFDENGNPILDFYIRFEHLREYYQTGCKRIGMPFVELPRPKSGIRSHGCNYGQYYTQEIRAILARYFKREIDYYNYQFD